ncbi:hypothetical protein [Methylobacterium aquaticum]|uniref:hypothetical protein n=1 Tax=Methylobacterium aquaticum TaxID=270351 RepID=UPI001932BE77|nr:hypothetical protein [Methylobacterium aquaticum]QRE77250.1 hypothetical protein F1D61_30260 [Methylobacterium aquaticum]
MSEHGLRRERYPVGDFIWTNLSEAERAHLRRFARDADGRDEEDEGYCTLGNAGLSVPGEPGEPVEDGDLRLLLEYMSSARLIDVPTDEGEWYYILGLATPTEGSRDRIGRLFALATDIDDEEAFDEEERSERIVEWQRQCARLRALRRLGYLDPEVPARPALTRWAEEGGPIPVVDNGSAQLDLDIEGE